MKNTSDFNYNSIVSIILIVLLAVARAFCNELFIYQNDFAPSGISGIATMVQYMFDFKVGYFSLIINIPLILIGWNHLSHDYAIRSTAYVFAFSAANIVFRSMDLAPYAFIAKDGGEAIMAAVAAGVCGGVDFTVANRLGGSTGGSDIVAAIVHKKNPEYDLTSINFTINTSVAMISFFVYGRRYTSVILCIIYVFVNAQLSGSILRGARSAVRFEIITNDPETLAIDLMKNLKHGCSLVPVEGMYSHKIRKMLICVVNRHQVEDCRKIIDKYPGSFASVTSVSNIYGNFKKIK